MTAPLAPPDVFLAATAGYDDADVVLLGVPYDGTTTFRPGTVSGPAAIRAYSDALEEFSFARGEPLEGHRIHDAGDVLLTMGAAPETVVSMVQREASRHLERGKRLLGLGGEHLVTLGFVRAYRQRYGDLAVLQVDAHADLRDTWEGEPLNHASVMRLIGEELGMGSIAQLGIRSGTREEHELSHSHGTVFPFDQEGIEGALARLAGRPLFVTIDIDVFDPSVVPGTGCPEPGGIGWRDMALLIDALAARGSIVGADVVELAPGLDPTGASSIVTAKVVRDLLITCFE